MLEEDSRSLAANPLIIKGRKYKKHHTHWYDDGNMAFLAGSVVFRVHGSLLSRRSPIMADLFQIPTPSPTSTRTKDSDVIIEGLPFVTLHDSANDFAHVLDFIYPDNLPGAETWHLGLQDFMGMAKLANKYLIDDLRVWAVDKLADRKHLLVTGNRSWQAALDDKRRYWNPEFSVNVIKFSRECSLPQFLPAAFYVLATTDWEIFSDSAECVQDLCISDQARIHAGRVALMKEVLRKSLATSEFGEAVAKCRAWGCKKPTPPTTDYGEVRYTNLMLHPIEELECRLVMSYPSLCHDCQTKRVMEMLAFRNELVDSLEQFFAL